MEKLQEEGKVSEAYSKATQSSKINSEMIEEAKTFLMPWVCRILKPLVKARLRLPT